MAFVLDANPSSSTMNSYVSLAEADDYFAGNFSAMARWEELTESQKNAALRQATLILDNLAYAGYKTVSTQPLQHPRKSVVDREGYAYDENVVITKVKYATCELAYWIANEENRLFDDTELEQFKSINMGPINATKDDGYEASDLPGAVKDMLEAVSPGFMKDDVGSSSPKFIRL